MPATGCKNLSQCFPVQGFNGSSLRQKFLYQKGTIYGALSLLQVLGLMLQPVMGRGMGEEGGANVNKICSVFSESIPSIKKDRMITPITQTQSRILVSDVTEQLSVILKGRGSSCPVVIGEVFRK